MPKAACLVKRAPKNAQEWLDRIVEASRTGGFPSGAYGNIDEGDYECKYRTTKKNKVVACVVGLAISDRNYGQEMEGQTVARPCVHEKLPMWIRKKYSMDQLKGLQHIHDNIAMKCGRQGGRWPHRKFLKRLLNSSIFKGMTPTKS